MSSCSVISGESAVRAEKTMKREEEEKRIFSGGGLAFVGEKKWEPPS